MSFSDEFAGGGGKISPGGQAPVPPSLAPALRLTLPSVSIIAYNLT